MQDNTKYRYFVKFAIILQIICNSIEILNGLAAYLCGIDNSSTLQKSFLKGRFFETFIFNEIRKSYMNEGIMQELYYYRDSDQNEVDLILLNNGTLSCIEIKTGQTFNASETKAFKKLDNTKYEKGKNAIICSVDKI